MLILAMDVNNYNYIEYFVLIIRSFLNEFPNNLNSILSNNAYVLPEKYIFLNFQLELLEKELSKKLGYIINVLEIDKIHF